MACRGNKRIMGGQEEGETEKTRGVEELEDPEGDGGDGGEGGGEPHGKPRGTVAVREEGQDEQRVRMREGQDERRVSVAVPCVRLRVMACMKKVLGSGGYMKVEVGLMMSGVSRSVRSSCMCGLWCRPYMRLTCSISGLTFSPVRLSFICVMGVKSSAVTAVESETVCVTLCAAASSAVRADVILNVMSSLWLVNVSSVFDS